MGGDFLRWRGDGKELFVSSAKQMMAAACRSARGAPTTCQRHGECFLTNVWDMDPGTTPTTFAVNWHRGR